MSPPFPRYLIVNDHAEIQHKSCTPWAVTVESSSILECYPVSQHCTVYYRLYSKECALALRYPIFTNDPFISRIVSKSLPPPPIAASLKSYLYRIGGFELPEHCDLYLSLLEKAPLDDSTHLRLRVDNGPGSFEFDPIALVVNSAALEKQSAGGSTTESTQLFGEFGKERQYGAH